MVNFPAPVGGTPYPSDFAPSILFATLYGLLFPLMVYRMCDRRSRCTLLIGTLAFGVERIVIYSLRAVCARNESKRFSNGLLDYLQTSFGMGYIGIANDLVNIVRCLLVNPTYGSDKYPESPAGHTKDGVMQPPPEGTPDMPRMRFWTRRFTGTYGLCFLAATVPGIIAHTKFHKVLEDQSWADNVYKLRLVSTGVCLFLTLSLLSSLFWGKLKLERMSQRGAAVLGVLVSLITVIAIYRLYVMPLRITSLTAPSRLNTSGGKAAFYIFHCLPEWLCTLVLFSDNIRKTFGTGLAGDWRFRDETAREKKSRLEKEEKRAAKKAACREKDIELNEKKGDALVRVEDVKS